MAVPACLCLSLARQKCLAHRPVPGAQSRRRFVYNEASGIHEAEWDTMSSACNGFEQTRISRRHLLTVGAAGLLGLHLPALLRAEGTRRRKAPAKAVIFLHQFGGPSHLDTFDPKPDIPESFRGEFRPIRTAVPGVLISERLPRMARLADRYALVRSVHHDMKNHNSATYYSLTGHAPPLDDIRLRDTPELFPAYGSV